MRTVVHLEPEDFARELVHNPKMFMPERMSSIVGLP